MKKLLISSAIATVLGLTGCGGETLKEAQDNAATTPAKPYARVVFDPAASNVNIPNDLLMIPDGNLFDFTLNILGDDVVDPADPQYALGALDGWSTHHPFVINVDVPAGVEIDAASASASGSVRLYEAEQVLESDAPICQAIAAEVQAPGLPCLLGPELQFGVDFATQKSAAGVITVVPLKPLKPGQGYMLVVTDQLKDSEGRSVKGSTTWELATQDPETHPLGSADQKQLQSILDFFVTLLKGEGLDRDEVSYAAYFSTQSAGTVLSTVKQLQVGPFAQAFAAAMAQTGGDVAASQQAAAAYLPAVTIDDAAVPDVFTAFKATGVISAEQVAGLAQLGLNDCASVAAGTQSSNPVVAGTAAQMVGFCASNLKQGSITLPYYLSTTNPLGDWWRGACTGGSVLQSLGAEVVGNLVANGAVGSNNDLCQVASEGQLMDLNLAAIGINDPRNLTKYSPIPATNSMQTLDVQVTVPNEMIVGMTKPAAGWPVIILQHGITSKKEDMLAITGALSAAGFATVAIDHPLHGSRGMTIDGQVVNASGGYGGAPTDYLNLSSLLTARDNLRQSIADILGLRLGLNANVDMTNPANHLLDGSNVSFVGHSLGAIAGTGAVALANSSLGGDLAAFDTMYALKAATLANPGGGLGGFLLESPAFANLIKGSLMAASSPDFVAALTQYMQANQIPEATGEVLAGFFPVFYSQLTAEQKAEVDGTFAQFSFAAQTVIDAGDPNNYVGMVAANGTPIHMIEVVGGNPDDQGGTFLPDQVIPNTTSLPLAGTEPLAALMGLAPVSSTTQGGGLVRFLEGTHSSILDPGPSVAATTEMQKQTAAFMATMGSTIVVEDSGVVAQ
ncbi:VolA/Pla-1 family phospholipase [Neptunicella sp. SCSIO 80796]|uniref:VolA/Pla-1 family phospholipase n=1 Tax=Neptunicella plasticusilytica TaxID=3117012 RepID=UPI003A4DCC50